MMGAIMMRTHRYFSVLALMALLGLSGCLKTRAQLRDDSSDDREAYRPVPAHPVQAVQEAGPQSGGYAIDEMKSEFTRLEGRVEDLERSGKEANSKSNSADRDELKKLDARLQQVELAQTGLLETLKKLQDSPPVSAVEPVNLYKKATAQYQDEDLEGALESLNLYLKSPKGKKNEDAIFLRAECFYKLKQYKKAIVDYSKFPEKFGRSKLLPEALYKIGQSFDALGMRDDAKGFYQELVEKFPKTPEAKKARKKVK